MIVVHHLEDSRSQRILWLLEELGVPYEVRRYARDPQTRLAPPELLAVHPLGKSPVITDGERTLAETGAIVDYLVERHGGGCLAPPAGTDDRLRYTYWMHFAEGSAMPPQVMMLVFDMLPQSVPFLVRPIARLIGQGVKTQFLEPTITKQIDFMEAELGRGGWFAGGDFSAADVMMSFPVENLSTRGSLAGRPSLSTWLKTIRDRAAYKTALERGGPYAYAGS